MNDATTQPPKPGPLVHHCQHPGCTTWGSYGHNTFTKDERWFCRDHDPHGGRGSRGELGAG